MKYWKSFAKHAEDDGVISGSDVSEKTQDVLAEESAEDAVVAESKPAKKTAKVTFDEAQQARIEEIIGERLQRAREEHETELEEAKKLQQMNAEEKANYEKQKLERERDEALKKVARMELSQEAAIMLQVQGIEATKEVLSLVVRDTAQETSDSVNEFSRIVKASAEKLVKEQLAGKPPVAGKPAQKMTREEIAKISDPVKRLQATRENLDLFKK